MLFIIGRDFKSVFFILSKVSKFRFSGLKSLISFDLKSPLMNINSIDVFTSRPETIFGCTFLGISSNHDIVKNLEKSNELKAFLEKVDSLGSSRENIEKAPKEGYFTGLYALHPYEKGTKLYS